MTTFTDRLKAILTLEYVENQVSGPQLKKTLNELVANLASEKDLVAKMLFQDIYNAYIFNDLGDCQLNFKQAKFINKAAELVGL